MPPRKSIACELAAAILCGRLSKEGIINRSAALLGRRPAWLRGLAKRILAEFGEGSWPRRFRLERFMWADAGFQKTLRTPSTEVLFLSIARVGLQPKMCPAVGPRRAWKVPPLRNPGELARWLNLELNELAWFADRRTLEAKLPPGPLRHYRYRWQPKRDGSARLIESPKQRLKAIQRRVLKEILEQIPPHEAAHGFRAQRSIRTFVAPHIGRTIVLRLDLKDFFPSILRARILAIFMTAGYPERVAELLAGLCTNTIPREVTRAYPGADDLRTRRRIKLL